MTLRLFRVTLTMILLLVTRGSGQSASTGGELLSRPTTTTSSSSPLDIDAGETLLKQQALRSSEHNEQQQNKDEKEVPFCTPGMSMVMFMNGFRRSLGNKQEPDPNCLNYYFRTWTLTEVAKFHGAVVFSVLLAILTEGLAALRGVVLDHLNKGRVRRFIIIVLFTVQQFMGYIIMLTAMMYSIELFAAVLIGLAIGNRLFDRRQGPHNNTEQRREYRDPMRAPLLRR